MDRGPDAERQKGKMKKKKKKKKKSTASRTRGLVAQGKRRVKNELCVRRQDNAGRMAQRKIRVWRRLL
jgi:hypothetical protein